MSVQVKLRRGNTSQHSAFTGALAEVTIDTDKKTIVVHDGTTAGGFPLAPNTSFDVANAAFNSANNVAPQVAPSFNTANAAFDKANSANVLAYNTGIGANGYTDSATISANNYAGVMANSANAYAASLTPDLSPAFNKANDAYTQANAAYDKANSANVLAYNTGIGANAYSVSVGASGNAYVNLSTGAANAYSIVVGAASNDYTNTVGTSANNYAGVMANAANAIAAATYATTTNAAAAFARGNTSAQLAFFRVAANGINLDAASNADTLTVRSSNNIILIANSTNDSLQITQSPSGVTEGSYSSGISALTVDTYGRVTAVTGSAGYVTSSGVTSVSGTADRITSSGGTTPAIDLATSGVAATTYGGATNIPAITVDAYGRVTSASNVAVSSGGLTVSDQTTSASTFYPVFTTTTSGTMSVANVATTKLYFVPSTGTLSATVFNSLSDITFKTDVEEFDGISLLNSINPISFKWKDTESRSYGVIAQELEKELPELVETNDQGIKSVSYMPMIAMLIDVVKKQQKELEEIKTLLNTK